MGDISLQDVKLLNLAANGASGEDLEAKTGIPAAQALLRVRRILASRDVWTEVERRQLLLHSAQQLKSKVEKFLQADDPKSVSAYLAVLKTISEMFDKMGKISNEELEKVTRAQAQKMLQLIEAAYGRARGLLSDEYPEVPLELLDAAFAQGLREEVLDADA